ELKIGTPIDYDGSHSTALSWLYSVKAYLLINKDAYNDDDKKVAYALSYMKIGVAFAWATSYYEQCLRGSTPSFGKFDDFEKAFKTSFEPTDSAAEAIAKLRTLKMK
ncbi:hypothetical protein HYDPIDRAFT_45141, partial [Hydnomerulius pinastri MD-312]